LTHALSLASGESAGAIVWTPEALLALAYVGVFAGAIAYIAYFGLIDAAGAISANLVFYVTPAVATLGGWLLLGETISLLTVVGFAVIVAGFAVLGSKSIATWWRAVDPFGREDAQSTPTYPSRSD
jgi:drug/metabolite transporter (DMT)-like permease